jgi:hypothetical protein
MKREFVTQVLHGKNVHKEREESQMKKFFASLRDLYGQFSFFSEYCGADKRLSDLVD